jgi:ribosome-binding factor A
VKAVKTQLLRFTPTSREVRRVAGVRIRTVTRRTEQVNELLREEISALIRELHDPRLGGMITVTRVDVSPDLRRADAYVSVMGTEEERSGTMTALQSARPFVRRELGRRVRLRSTPDVRFTPDTSIEDAQHLTDLMRKTAAERGESF